MGFPQQKLGDVCRLINGRAYKKHEMLTEGPYPILRVGNFFTNRSWFYSDLQLHEDKYCDNGDLLYAWSASFGPRIWEGQKVIYHYHIWKIEIDETKVDKDYMFHLLDWDTELIKLAQGTGATMIHVTKGSMEKRLLPFPPIPEQQRIVAILDQAFADIEKARVNAEQNLKNARELFDSYLQQVFSQRGEGWASSQLKDITSKIGSGATPRGGNDSYKVEGTPLIRSMNVHDRRFVEKNIAFIDDEQADKLNNVIVEENDVLLNITGASVARCCVAHEDFLPARVNQHVSIIRVDKTIVSPPFLNFLLTSKFYKDQLLGIGEAGSTRQAITKAQIENFTVDYPVQVSAQIELLEGLLSLENQTLKVQKIYKNKLASLDELKKSLLQKAFSGELTKGEGRAA